MKITLPLVNPVSDDDRISDEVEKDFDHGCQIYVYKEEIEWKQNHETHAYGLWVEYGPGMQKTLMFEVDLDDLEMFAHSLLNSIEMLRRDYSDVIKSKIKNCDLL